MGFKISEVEAGRFDIITIITYFMHSDRQA